MRLESDDLQNMQQKMFEQHYKNLLSTVSGRIVFGSIFLLGGIYDPVYCDDAHIMAYTAGRRDTLMELRNTVAKIDPRLVADCETEFVEFDRRVKDSGGRDNEN